MVRVRLTWPRHPRHCPHIRTRDDVHNILVRFFLTAGVSRQLLDGIPAQYGFGVASGPRDANSLRPLYRLDVGSTHPQLTSVLHTLTPSVLAAVAPRWPLERLRITIDTTWWHSLTAFPVYALSPIRALQPTSAPHRTHAILEPGPSWVAALNHAMARRFHRPFSLVVDPDAEYLHTVGSRYIAQMAVKTLPSGRDLVLPGLVFPFILSGPNPDLRDAWFAGLGSGTGMGFGWLEAQSV